MRASTVKPVVQLDPTGCAIASAAAIAGVSYASAKRVAASIGISVHDSRLWSSVAPVRRLLARLGVETGRAKRPFRSWDALPALALLAVKWHTEHGRPFWHWVVFVRDENGARVLDSNQRVRHVRTDFGRMQPKWYVPVRTAS